MAEEFGADRLARDARRLDERLSEGLFYVACVGQFKRGKSTLIGALIGDSLLPTGVVPVTTVPTVIRHGAERRARVRFCSGTWTDIVPGDLYLYVSEEHNPENAKGVEGAEVFVTSPLLAAGMCLVDTPGLGSVFEAGSAATHAFVPHIDAAIIVTGADPPLAGEELTIVEAVSKHVPDLLVVLNKADRTTNAEREAARTFASRVLEKRLGRPAGPVLEVSALERLERRGPVRDWERLVQALLDLQMRSGRAILRQAGERGLRRLAEELLLIVAEERKALLSPIEEYERRIAALNTSIRDAQLSLQDLAVLLTAEQHRLSDTFLARRKDFLARGAEAVTCCFAEATKAIPRSFGPSFRRRAMLAAQRIAEQNVLPWLQAEQAFAESEYAKVASRFVEMTSEFLKRLAHAGIPELYRMPHAFDAELGFRIRSRFTFEALLHVSAPASPLRHLADLILGLAGGYSIIERDAREYLHYLLEMNSSRVQSDMIDRVQQSRGQLEAEIRRLLLEVGHIAQRALEHARTAKEVGEAAVAARIARLSEVEKEITNLCPVSS